MMMMMTPNTNTDKAAWYCEKVGRQFENTQQGASIKVEVVRKLIADGITPWKTLCTIPYRQHLFTCSLCSKNMTKAAALGAFNVIIIAQQTNQAEDDASV